MNIKPGPIRRPQPKPSQVVDVSHLISPAVRHAAAKEARRVGQTPSQFLSNAIRNLIQS
jgi:hypothetical protein